MCPNIKKCALIPKKIQTVITERVLVQQIISSYSYHIALERIHILFMPYFKQKHLVYNNIYLIDTISATCIP